MKASGSPCPLDQISVICFKRCPYLRSYLTEIIRSVWLSGTIPSEWKKACTILIHKKGETNDPSNFRPITLESVPLKVFTSCLRNAIFSFLSNNNLIDHQIQKGFTSKLSGTLEHTAQMANIIKKAKTKQRSLIITLLDLKNAFGEVHHNLIQEVLRYHHIPDHMQSLVRSLYTDFQTSFITSEFQTPFINVGRGVLQGDCLSPLLFNLCFNTFIQHIKDENYRQLGYAASINDGLSFNPVHWFQFADDAAVISGQESENQILLNRFTIWCQWAGMIIRVDKCVTFGMKKSSSKSHQYQPKLIINGELVPPVKIGDSFKYLGRHFDFEMSNQAHKTELSSTLNELMSKIDRLPLHPKNKLLLYNRHVLSKLSWHFTVADLSKTWISENLDNIVAKYVRTWLEIPISGTLSNIILAQNRFGLNILPPTVKFSQCQTVLRNTLKSSPNEEIRNLWKSTSCHTNLQYDTYKNTKDVLKVFRSEQEDRLQNQLTIQGSFFSNVISYSLPKLNSIWSSTQSKLPKNIYNFTIRYINNTLPTRKNLSKWGISSATDCSFCSLPESLLHVVAGCKTYLDQGRFTWRHDSVLQIIANSLLGVRGTNLYADMPGFTSPSLITGNELRPDLLLSIPQKCLYILELTVGFESNLLNNITRKNLKYKELVRQQRKHYNDVKFINLSISTLGVFSSQSTDFLEMLKDVGFEIQHQNFLLRRMINAAIRSTYFIFCRRNKDWDSPELLKF